MSKKVECFENLRVGFRIDTTHQDWSLREYLDFKGARVEAIGADWVVVRDEFGRPRLLEPDDLCFPLVEHPCDCEDCAAERNRGYE